MNKNGKLIASLVVLVIIIGGIYWYGHSSSPSYSDDSMASSTGLSATPSVPVSETTKVSDGTQLYTNDELGFSVKYPSAWEKDESNGGVNFIMPIDKSQVSTVATLQATISVASGKCAFPPVTTVKDRGTVAIGAGSLSMISMANNVQGRDYFNRMYSLQKGAICYIFAFSAISLSTSSLTGSNLTQAQNNNKAIVNTADAAFTTMVKSFAFVVGPAGEDESQASPATPK